MPSTFVPRLSLSLSMPGSPSSKIVCASQAPTARSAPVSRQTSRPSIQVLARPTMAARARPFTARSQSAATRPALKVHSARTLSHLTKGAIPASLIEAPHKNHMPCTHLSTSISGTARSGTARLYGTRTLPEQTGADHLLCRISVDLAQLKGNPQKLEAVRQRLTPRQPLTLALRSRVEALKSQLHTKDARIAELEATLQGSRSTTASNHSSTTSGPCSPTGEGDASWEAEASSVPSPGQASRAEAEGSSHGAHKEERDEALDEDCDRLLSVASRVLDFDVCAAPPPPPAPPAPPPAPPARPPAPPPPPIAIVHLIEPDAPCTQAPSPAILSTPLSWEAPATAPALASPAMTSPRSPCRTPREDRVFDYFAGQAYGRTSFIIEVFAEERARREVEEAEAEAARALAAERRAIAEAASERLAAPSQRRVQPLSSAAFERRTRDAEKARPEAALDFVRIPEKRERYKTPATRAAEAKAAAAAQVQAECDEHSPRCSREPLSARTVVSVEEQEQEGNETEDDEEEIERRRSERLSFRRRL